MEKFEFDPYTTKDIVGFFEEPAKKIPVVSKVDVLVVGGSQSGVTAAISAARNGAKVMIVERFGFLGGQSVGAMVVQWEKRGFINNLGAVLTKGIPKELLDSVVEKRGSDGMWDTPPGCPEMRDGEEYLDPEAIKITFFKACEKENIEILLHTMAVDVMVDKTGDLPRLTGAIFENKSGRFAISSEVVIDATADLDLIWRAIGEEGCSYREPIQRIQNGFYTWYGNVNDEKFIDWYINNPNSSGGYPDVSKYPGKVKQHLEEDKLIKINASVFNSVLEKADESGLMDVIEEILEKYEITGFLTLGMKNAGKSRWSLHFVGVVCNLLDSWDVSKKEIFRQKLDYYMLPIMRLIPGWENCNISREGIYLGGRESRVLKAMKVINQDLLWASENETSPTPDDAIGRSGAHDPGKNMLKAGYPVPYGILVPDKLDGALVCARSVGTKHDRSLDAHRGIIPGMITGQGAGTAAAIAVKDKVSPRDVDLKKLQIQLREDGVQLDHEHVGFDFEITRDRVRTKPRAVEGTQSPGDDF